MKSPFFRRLFNRPTNRKLIMTLFERIEAIEPKLTQALADIEALKAQPAGTDFGPSIAAVEAKVDTFAALVGTPATAA